MGWWGKYATLSLVCQRRGVFGQIAAQAGRVRLALGRWGEVFIIMVLIKLFALKMEE